MTSDLDALRSLVVRVVAGDGAAWVALQEAVLPVLERWARTHSGMKRRGLARSEDDVREVVVAVLERLHAGGYQNLRFHLSTSHAASSGAFGRWLYGSLDFAVREHLRMRFGRVDHREPDGGRGPSKRDLNTLAPRYEEELHAITRTGITGRVTLRQVMAHVETSFAPLEARALRLYIEREASFEELRLALCLESAGAAERMIRKLKERLRVHFRGGA